MSIAPEIESLVLGPEHNGIRMTPEEFDLVTDCDRCYRYELVHGVLVVSPYPPAQDRAANQELGYLLRLYHDRHPQGSSLDDTLPEETMRTRRSRHRTDRAIWTGFGRQTNPRKDHPTIAVEFVSSGRRNWRRDYVEKRDEYRETSLKEYWVINRFRRNMTAFRRTPDGWEELTVREDEVYRTDLLPGFELPLARILAVADS